MAGRRPKPTAIKTLQGNPGHRPLNDKELVAPKGEPEMPKGMLPAARREWKNIVPLLMKLGVLSQIDGKALAAYCDTFAHMEKSRKDIEKYGLVVEEPVIDKFNNPVVLGSIPGVPPEAGASYLVKLKANPAVANYALFAKLMKSFLIEFGLTPASRAKLKVEADTGDTDPFELLMAGRQVPVIGDQKPV
jgi:P27 family predicted phage terminase small subunit